MSIQRVSRYYTGTLAQTPNKYTGVYEISVFRKFTDNKKVSYTSHVWSEGDSLGSLAKAFGLGAKFWWEIMDINPEIIDPFAIIPGTIIRIPYGNK
jgi:hypothetical protein